MFKSNKKSKARWLKKDVYFKCMQNGVLFVINLSHNTQKQSP